MGNPTAAMLVIGDEILSGRTRDANMHFLASELVKHGIRLSEVRIVPDIEPRIVEALNALRAAYDTVFTSGGIGPTHDDITADAVAKAFGVGIDVREDARALMQDYCDRMGRDLNEARLRMARIPDGASLIENPISAAPGFRIGNVCVMAGVPSIFQAMVAGVLPTLTGGDALLSQNLTVQRAEGDIAAALRGLAEDFGDLSIGSYPFIRDGVYGTNVVIRGTDGVRIDAAMGRLSALFPEAVA
ncbi:competence/damage-inducible protein A [Rhodovulum strictum]|uniref:Competence/damage-inducible protein A n=1 Tax=Rhodovulum strictum TaxID=58314 RepID=A0A844B986_9RHOB|nr:molybdopterin-binding protein [Rhodovulum strictum]MRH20974.1 competence/damage-inducible protein A [Rhodovulum strictum]